MYIHFTKGTWFTQLIFCNFYTPPHVSGGIWFHIGCPCVCASICCVFFLHCIFIFGGEVSGVITSKFQWIFTKLGMYIDIVEVWFGIANGPTSSIFDELFARDSSVFSFLDNYSSKYQWILSKLGRCIDIVEIWFWIANGQV